MIPTWEREFSAICARGHHTYRRIKFTYPWWPASDGDPDDGLAPVPSDPLPEIRCGGTYLGQACDAPTRVTYMPPV